MGFDYTNIEIIAMMVLFHKKAYQRKSNVKVVALAKRRQRIVKALCVILKIADSLDRSTWSLHHSAIFCKLDKGCVALNIESETNFDLDLWGLDAHRKNCDRAFGLQLVIRILYSATTADHA